MSQGFTGNTLRAFDPLLPALTVVGFAVVGTLDNCLTRQGQRESAQALREFAVGAGVWRYADRQVIPTPSHVLGRISPIFPPVFSRFLRVFTVSTRRF